MNKIAMYTAITGGKNKLRAPIVRTAGVDYIAFVDDPSIKAVDVEVRQFNRPEVPILAAKYPKLFPHKLLPEYDISIWIDGGVSPTLDVTELVERALATDNLAFFKHPWRTCLFDEADACIHQGRINADEMRKQTSAYLSEGMSRKAGLMRGTVIFRRHGDPLVETAMDMWWEEVRDRTTRDQVSLPYVVRKSGVRCTTLPAGQYELYFNQARHKKFRKGDDRLNTSPKGKNSRKKYVRPIK